MDRIRIYNVRELSELLGMTERGVRKYLREGKIKGVKAGGHWLVTEEALREFLLCKQN